MAEISEGFCVAACMFTPEKLAKEIKAAKDPKKGLESLKAFMKEVEKVAKTKDKIKYGSEESVFKNSYDPENAVSLSNFAQGISGAVAIHDWLQRHHNESITPSKWTGYLTGAKWPHEVEHLRVHDYGMKDYNSADFLIYTGKQSGYDYYYGISLKKKGVSVGGAKVADPTLINKAFTSILNKKDGKVKELINEIDTHKAKFFSDVVREAAAGNVINAQHPLGGSKLGSLKSSNKLWTENLREKKYLTNGEIKTRALINIKGKGKVDLSKKSKLIGEGQPNSLYRAKTGERPWLMRDLVNSKIQKYFSGLEKVLQTYAKVFANALINLILKEQLYHIMDENEKLENTYFGFALVTGTATVTKSLAMINKGEAKELHMVLCALADMNNKGKEYKLKKVANPKFNGEVPEDDSDDNAAKVFYDLSKGKTTILHLHIRYKGSFTPQPQFQATLSDDFKELILGFRTSTKCIKFD
jgi:hypothetical protein